MSRTLLSMNWSSIVAFLIDTVTIVFLEIMIPQGAVSYLITSLYSFLGKGMSTMTRTSPVSSSESIRGLSSSSNAYLINSVGIFNALATLLISSSVGAYIFIQQSSQIL